MGRTTHRIPVPNDPDVLLAVDDSTPGGPPIEQAIFLPGFGATRTGNKSTTLGERLPEIGVRFIALDYEGHGDSTGSFSNLTLRRHLRDYQTVRGALLKEAPHILIGSSMGGLIASMAANQEPDRIRAMILIAPAFGFRKRFEQHLGEARLEDWDRTGTLVYSGEFFSAQLDRELLVDFRNLDEDEVIAGIRCPVLLIHGTADATVPVYHADHFVRTCQAPVEFVRIEGGTHRLEGHLDILSTSIVHFLEQLR